jgi:hypothetical protein
MSKMNELSAVVTWFAGLMVGNLARPSNVAKSDWRKVDVHKYLDGVQRNLDRMRTGSVDVEQFVDNLTDIANDAMLAAAMLKQEARHVEF